VKRVEIVDFHPLYKSFPRYRNFSIEKDLSPCPTYYKYSKMTLPKYMTLRLTDNNSKIFVELKKQNCICCTHRTYRMSDYFPDSVDTRGRYRREDITKEVITELVSTFLDWYSQKNTSSWEIHSHYFDTFLYLHSND